MIHLSVSFFTNKPSPIRVCYFLVSHAWHKEGKEKDWLSLVEKERGQNNRMEMQGIKNIYPKKLMQRIS